MHMYLYMICPHRFVLTILHNVGKGVTPSNDEKEDVSLSGGQPKNNKGKVDETLIANTKYSQKPSDSYSNEDSHTTKEKTNDSLKTNENYYTVYKNTCSIASTNIIMSTSTRTSSNTMCWTSGLVALGSAKVHYLQMHLG